MPSLRPNRIQSLFRELRRRRVFRVLAVYVVGAFATLQGADILVPALHLPEWTMTALVGLAIVGLPVAIALSWIFDIVPGGIERTRSEADAVLRESVARPELDAAPARGAAPDRGARSAPPAAASRACIAVVPFLNLSADEENDVFANGITEDVIAHLSKISALKVISRTSVMPFKERKQSLREIGAALGAGTLLDGSVRRVGDRVRIVAKLVDVEGDRHLWAETYDRELTDIFAIQTDVALHIAAALRAELSSDEQSRIRKQPTTNLRAYQLYMQGRHWFIRYTPTSMKRAIEYFNRAIADDPEYAPAHAAVGMAYAELAETGAIATDVARHRAVEAAGHAVRLDPALGEAHCLLAHLKALWEFDWDGAEDEFRRAIELSPSSADAYDLYGRLCAALERFDEALVLQRKAQELDPLAHRLDVATTLLRAGRYAEAEVEAAHALDFDPEHDRAHATLGWAYFKQGRTEAGLAELERAVDLSPDNTQWLAQLGQALALAGRTEDAREILHRLEARDTSGFITPYHIAFVYTGLGEHDRALDLLEQAFEERASAVYGIKGSFLFAPLRQHPRFQALLEKINAA